MSKEKELEPKLRFREFEDCDVWNSYKLGNIAQILTGGTPSTKVEDYWYPKEIPWMASGEINKKRLFKTDNLISYNGFENSSATWIKEKSVLIALAGQGKTRGTVAINEIPLTTNQSIAAILPFKNKLYPEFLYQNLDNRYEELRLVSSGDGTRGGLNKDIISELQVKAPNILEQKMIGNFFKKLDQMIQVQQSKVNKVKDLKSAYLSEMFPKEGEKYPKRRFEGFTKPWKLTKFNEIADVKRGLTYHPSDIVEKGGVRVLRSSNIDEDTFITKDDDVFVNENAINIEFSQKQNILITSANGSPHLVGKHAILEQLETPSVHGGFMLLARTASPYFLNASMSSDWYRKFIRYHVAGGGGSIGNIKKSDLEHQLIYIPSKEEQEKIGQFFKNLDNQISIEEEKLAKLEKLKQAYLNDMFV